MSTDALSYGVVTPARNEAEGIRRLASCLTAQGRTPQSWIVVDNGSHDGTGALVRELGADHPWIRLIESEPEGPAAPGAQVVRAFQAGIAALEELPDVIVKLDADVSFEADYFERLLTCFGRDPILGIAGGVCYERHDDDWVSTHATGTSVRGATRAYRRACLQQVLPLEERMGWDGADELKAQVLGWRTATIEELAFYHHRRVGERDGGRHRRWAAQGRGSRALGYRFSYLVLRTLFHARRDPSALAMIWGYVGAAARREPMLEPAARAVLRDRQRVRALPARLREARGRRRDPAAPQRHASG